MRAKSDRILVYRKRSLYSNSSSFSSLSRSVLATYRSIAPVFFLEVLYPCILSVIFNTGPTEHSCSCPRSNILRIAVTHSTQKVDSARPLTATQISTLQDLDCHAESRLCKTSIPRTISKIFRRPFWSYSQAIWRQIQETSSQVILEDNRKQFAGYLAGYSNAIRRSFESHSEVIQEINSRATSQVILEPFGVERLWKEPYRYAREVWYTPCSPQTLFGCASL